jgi:hypothetical protein
MKLKITDAEELSEFISKLRQDKYKCDWIESFDLSETLSGPAVVEIDEEENKYMVRLMTFGEEGFDNVEETKEEFKASFKLDTTAAEKSDLFKNIFKKKDSGSDLDDLANTQRRNLMVIQHAKEHDTKVMRDGDGNLFEVIKILSDGSHLVLECVDPEHELFMTKVIKHLTST